MYAEHLIFYLTGEQEEQECLLNAWCFVFDRRTGETGESAERLVFCFFDRRTGVTEESIKSQIYILFLLFYCLNNQIVW